MKLWSRRTKLSKKKCPNDNKIFEKLTVIEHAGVPVGTTKEPRVWKVIVSLSPAAIVMPIGGLIKMLKLPVRPIVGVATVTVAACSIPCPFATYISAIKMLVFVPPKVVFF